MSNYVELYIDQGASFSISVNIEDDDTNLATDVSSYVVTGQLRKSILSQNASANLVCSISNTAGEIVITLDAANTANLKAGTYLFDVKYYDSDVVPIQYVRLLEGIFIVSPSITK